ncbi:GNAT family N-acetyltransferase [Streptomyces sp. NBC_00820]|uniref:GNAT family N-acetyltransferase n=1 Tax=Streptomyces sp. NBC_00820 TaxID=2975842 RepID=UPI002ED33AF4|nr:GNAT family N-acetyltransferase [Streptomyces sp. NBC_00820]
MISDDRIPDVVPAGAMADVDQPVLDLPGGLELRPWRTGDADADALLAGGQDPAIRQWNLFSVGSRDEARARIARMHERWRAETGAVWAIARPGGPPLGLTGLHSVKLAEGNAEIMYWVLPEARGGGIVVEATRRIGRWALDDLGLHRLRLCHAVTNTASCHVAEKLGYALEGTMRSSLLHADGWHDEHLHALVGGEA